MSVNKRRPKPTPPRRHRSTQATNGPRIIVKQTEQEKGAVLASQQAKRYLRTQPRKRSAPPKRWSARTKQADVAELADALDSGSSARKGVEVQVLSSALSKSWAFSRFGLSPLLLRLVALIQQVTQQVTPLQKHWIRVAGRMVGTYPILGSRLVIVSSIQWRHFKKSPRALFMS